MNWREDLLEREQEARINEVMDAIENDQVLGEGKNKTVYLTNRNEVVKPLQDNILENEFLGDLNILEKIEEFPRTEVHFADLSDIDLWCETALVFQKRADMGHKKALQKYGFGIIDQVTDIFDGLNQQGFIYMDSKPKNIGFVRSEQDYRAAPIDILDDSAYSLFPDYEDLGTVDQNILVSNVAHQYDLYINGSEYERGLIDELHQEVQDRSSLEKYFTLRALDRSELLEKVPYKENTYNTVRTSLEKKLEL